MMRSISFRSGTQFQLKGVNYVVVSRHEDDKIKIENLETGERDTVTQRELVNAYYRDEIRFENSPTHQPLLLGETHWGDIPDSQRKVAEFRYRVIEPLIPVHGAELKQAVLLRVEEYRQQSESADGSSSPGKSTLYAWLKAFRDAGNDKRALIPRKSYRAPGASHFGSDVEHIMGTVIKDHMHLPSRPGIDALYRAIKLLIFQENRMRPKEDRLSTPSRMTVWRRVERMDLEGKLRDVRKTSPRVPLRIQQESFTRPHVPLEVVEIDHTVLDVMIVDEESGLVLGKPTFTICLDVATGYPLGYYLGCLSPGYHPVLECLFHAILPKEDVKNRFGLENDWLAFGLPQTLVVDNGREFLSKALEDACYQLGILLEIAPVATPQKKSHVERFFRTINEKVIHRIHGTTYSNPQKRGDYNSQEEASHTLKDLHELIHMFIVDIYAQTIHRGIGDTPARAWQGFIDQGLFAPQLSPPPAELARILSAPYERKLQPYGIELNGITYTNPELQVLRTRLLSDNGSATATVRLHPGDVGQVFVHDPYEKRYIAAPSKDPRLSGRSLSVHKRLQEIKREYGGQQDDIATARAERKLDKKIGDGKKSKNLSERKQAARLKESNKTPSVSAIRVENATRSNDSTEEVDKRVRPSFVGNVDLDSERESYLGKKTRRPISRSGQSNQESTGEDQE